MTEKPAGSAAFFYLFGMAKGLSQRAFETITAYSMNVYPFMLKNVKQKLLKKRTVITFIATA